MPFKPSTKLTKELAHQLYKDVDNFLFDCDGVIWHWPNPIPGSVEFINTLKKMGKKVFFITNNSTKTRQMCLDKFAHLGVSNVVEEDIVCTSWLLASWLKAKNFTDKVFVIGNPSIEKELDLQGIRHVGIGPTHFKIPDPANYDYVNQLKLDDEVKAVAVGFDHHFNYPKMIEATSYAYNDPDCLFVATNDDAMFPSNGSSKICVPGTGTFVNCLKTSIGRDPVMLGKPHRTMWEVLEKLHGLDPSRSCMVGDRLDTDIVFAANCGLKYSLAVLSGICSEEQIMHFSDRLDENEKSGDEKARKQVPDFYTSRLGDFLELTKE